MDDMTALHTQLARLEERIAAQDEQYKLHFELNDKAINAAKEETDIHLGNLNNFKAETLRMEGVYQRREVSDKRYAVIETRLQKLEMSGAFNSGKSWMIVSIVAAIPTVLALVALFSK